MAELNYIIFVLNLYYSDYDLYFNHSQLTLLYVKIFILMKKINSNQLTEAILTSAHYTNLHRNNIITLNYLNLLYH